MADFVTLSYQTEVKFDRVLNLGIQYFTCNYSYKMLTVRAFIKLMGKYSHYTKSGELS